MKRLTKFLPDVFVVLLFVAVSFVYFFPADTEGRILFRHDSAAGRGMGVEAQAFKERTGEVTRWTNSLFGGMPTYQSAPSYDSTDSLKSVVDAYHLWLPENVWYVFVYLLGFYILLRAFDFKWYLSMLGAIVWAFSSYFFIIIAAGHIWKVMALAYLPPMIAGVLLAYVKKKYLPALAVTGIFTAFEIVANHVQMTYYYLFIILFMVIGFLVDAIRKKELGHFVKASAVCLIGGLLGVAVNVSNLYHTWQYQNESMRGKSELVKADTGNQTSSGLERDYITQWSYGIGETWTLLVPNTKGGTSMSTLSMNKAAMEKANPDYAGVYQQIGQYWGEQPGTSGPVYVGAFVLFLFILGLFLVKGSLKWSLLAATVLSIMLAWGKNFMPLTDFFIDNVPMYAKFRTVASILVIAEFTIPLLAMLALKRICDEPELLKTKQKWVFTSLGLTGGIALLFYLFPTMFFGSYISEAEMQAFSQIPQEQLGGLLANLKECRIAMFKADCIRTVFIILLGFAALMAYRFKKLSAVAMVCMISVICLVDMWQVNKRYLNDDMFVSVSMREAPQEKTQTDEIILQDKALDYRVLNFASNTFNENETSYFHKSIGGYHAAKLRRYQEVIEAHIAPEMQKTMGAIVDAQGDMTKVNADSIYPVINMLNTKYFIMPLQSGETTPIANPYAMGNAWFVNKVEYVDNANQELEALGKLNLREAAVADKQFKDVLGEAVPVAEGDSTANSITLKSYEPNELHYDVNTAKGGVVVFSEVYYPGWTCTVDGESVEVGRVNYILRAISVKPGKHEVVMEFKPTSISTTETIAYTALIILLIVLIASIVLGARKGREKKDVANEE